MKNLQKNWKDIINEQYKQKAEKMQSTDIWDKASKARKEKNERLYIDTVYPTLHYAIAKRLRLNNYDANGIMTDDVKQQVYIDACDYLYSDNGKKHFLDEKLSSKDFYNKLATSLSNTIKYRLRKESEKNELPVDYNATINDLENTFNDSISNLVMQTKDIQAIQSLDGSLDLSLLQSILSIAQYNALLRYIIKGERIPTKTKEKIKSYNLGHDIDIQALATYLRDNIQLVARISKAIQTNIK